MATAAELRALAAQLEAIETLEDVAREVKARYRANLDDPDLKAAHRRASQALAEARDATRPEILTVTGQEG